MDVIEQGFSAIMEKIKQLKEKKDELSAEVKAHDAQLLQRMSESAGPLISSIGLDLLDKGKINGKGEIYDSTYYVEKLLVLGKTDPVGYRPDNPTKEVSNQFCVLSETGDFFELMYSSDGFFIDSYLNPISPQEVLDLYGYDVMFMLYKAMEEYLKDEEELVGALGRIIEYIF